MTLTELKAAVLRELGVLATGESPNAADAELVAEKYAELYELLLTEGLVSWAAADDVPAFAARPVTWMVAHLSSSEFAVPLAKANEMAIKGAVSSTPPSLGERILRRQLARDFVYSPARTEYF